MLWSSWLGPSSRAKENIERVQGLPDLLLDQRPEFEVAGIAVLERMAVFSVKAEIGPILALLRQLERVLERDRRQAHPFARACIAIGFEFEFGLPP